MSRARSRGLASPSISARVSARGRVVLDPSTIGPLALETRAARSQPQRSRRRHHGLRGRRTARQRESERPPGARRSRAVEPHLHRVAHPARRHRAVRRPHARRPGARGRHHHRQPRRPRVEGHGRRSPASRWTTRSTRSLSTPRSTRTCRTSSSRAVTADVKTDATLVNVAGRPIPSLKATVAYADNRFRFEATANETGRTITASGDLALLEGGREVTISRAALTAGPATWALADAGPVRVRIQNNLLTLPQPVTLVNNGQELLGRGHAGPHRRRHRVARRRHLRRQPHRARRAVPRQPPARRHADAATRASPAARPRATSSATSSCWPASSTATRSSRSTRWSTTATSGHRWTRS